MNDFRIAFFIAYKSIIRGSRSMIILLVFILSLSFLNMMFISGILNGLENLFRTALLDTYSSYITVNPQQEPQAKQYIVNQNEVQTEIKTIPGVISTTRRYSLAGSMAFDKDKNGVYKSISGEIVGIDPTQEKKVLTINNLMLKGQYLSDTDTNQIIMSSALAGGYGMPAPSDLGGVKVGDKVRVTYSNGIIRTYTVKGIYNDSIGIFETFITAKEAESVLSVFNNASKILVKTDLTRAPVTAYQAKIQHMFPKLKIQNFNDLLGTFASFLNALNLISIIVSAISVVVAAITIFVLIYVNAINKRRQIGILKAIGIKERIIVLSYVFQSMFFTFFGLVIGSILVFGILTPLLAAHPIDVEFGYLSLSNRAIAIVAGVISMFVTGLLAGFVPARMVTREDILKAIWG